MKLELHNKAIAILRKTEDGNKLNPRDLRLLEIAVNGRASLDGLEAFDTLYLDVISGTYEYEARPVLVAPHLTKDRAGNVYWKGRCIEHFSYRDREEEEVAAAARLARRCEQLEARGFPVTGRTALSPECYEAPKGTPWMTALCRYYSFLQRGKTIAGLFYRDRETTVDDPHHVIAVIRKDDGTIELAKKRGAYEAFHWLQDELGFHPMPRPAMESAYDRLVATFQALGLAPAELEKVIRD